jgi:pimeloyl-ACP methyl ester carboxylesterase
MRHPFRPVILIAAGIGAAFVANPATAPADAVYLKDGTILHGKVRREADAVSDPVTGAMVPVFKANDYFIIDDKVRWVLFSGKKDNVINADPDVNIRNDFITLLNPRPIGQDKPMPGKVGVRLFTPFDSKWSRIAKLNTFMTVAPNTPEQVLPMEATQRLMTLTPYAAVVQTQHYRWNMSYLTQELGIDLVKMLLDNHPDLVETNGPDLDRRLKRFRFLLQAGWLLEAEKELDRAARDLPQDGKDVKERMERARLAARQAQVRDLWDEIQTAHRAGRYQFVRGHLNRLPLNEVDGRVAAEAAKLKAKYDEWDRQAIELTRVLDALSGQFVGPPTATTATAEAVIRAEAGPDTLERLEPFLTIAGQYLKELDGGKTPTYSRDDVFAVAVSGWVMGRESAEPKPAVAERYWAAREFLLAHTRTHDTAARARLYSEYQQRAPLSLDETTQLISLLPPSEPPEKGKVVGLDVEERATSVSWTQKKSVPYLLKLPPEYRTSRSYPVLIVLNASGERPGDAMLRWINEAARRGYILAAPAWSGAGGYNYSTAEHDVVTELVIDLRRHYAVDSDRVFLTGYGDGATMAFDVGLSHPDLFAGIVPVNAQPNGTSVAWYWRNAQYLPYYIVTAEQAGKVVSANRYPFENWMARGYAALMVVYKGRTMEPLAGEALFAFDWMDKQKRAAGFPELGRNPNSGVNSEEFQAMRAGDNHFYWISLEQIQDRYLNNEIGLRKGAPAALQASVRDNNSVYVNCRGIKTMRLWFGRIWDPQTGWRTMLDFTKPVKVFVNGKAWGKQHVITPSLQTLLDDLYQRGDRQRMFMSSVELSNLP